MYLAIMTEKWERQQLIQLLEKNDVHLLVNRSIERTIDRTPIRLVGVNDGFSGKVNIYDAFREVKEDDIVIFIAHAPAYFNNAKKVSKPHLLLAGHLHGGQIRFGPFGIYENGAFKEKKIVRSLLVMVLERQACLYD